MGHREVPLALRMFRWSCEDDCKYQCMRAVETWKASHPGASGLAPVEKYYGKWPFTRVYGMQELVSVLASLANLVAHCVCLTRLRSASQPSRPIPGTGLPTAVPATASAIVGTIRSKYPFLGLWTAYSCLHMNAWLWSAMFHSRDTRTTERLDYTSAISLVAFGLFAAAARMLWATHRWRRIAAVASGAVIAAGLLAHLRYMLLVKFDYGWNMQVCVAVGVATAGLWLGWCAWTRHPARRRMYAFLLLVHLCMLLEVLDFPPVAGLLDAHAAWHIATVPLTPLFYSWLHADAAMLAEQKRKDT